MNLLITGASGLLGRSVFKRLSADPSPQFAKPRPRNCQLDKSRLTDMGISASEPLMEQLSRSLKPFV